MAALATSRLELRPGQVRVEKATVVPGNRALRRTGDRRGAAAGLVSGTAFAPRLGWSLRRVVDPGDCAARRQARRVANPSCRAGNADDPAAQRVVRLTVLRRIDDERDETRLDEPKPERDRALADRTARLGIVVRPVVDELSRDRGETVSPWTPLRGRVRGGARQESCCACRADEEQDDSEADTAHASNTGRSSRSYLIDGGASGATQVPDRQRDEVRGGRRGVLSARVVDPAADVDGARRVERRCEGQRKRSVAHRAGARPDVQRRRCADSRAGGSGALGLARDRRRRRARGGRPGR